MAMNGHADLSSHDKAILNKIFNPNLPYNDVIEDTDEAPVDVETEEDKQAKALEVEGVTAAEKGDTLKALELFTQAIDTAPGRASCYNNRAQARQLATDIDGAIKDLEKAIELSHGEGKVACQAYTQRGIIHKFQANEDTARADFEAASKLGGEFAKQQVIAMNPYAALCNQMMSEVIRKVQTGQA